MRNNLLVIFCSLLMVSMSCFGDTPQKKQETTDSVINTLSQRSGLPTVDLQTMLSNCEANQQNMYFCAWRDLIQSDKLFFEKLKLKQQQMPKCKALGESKAVAWQKSRARTCEKQATQDYGNGSMKPTAQLICMNSEAERMVKKLDGMKDCQLTY
jgi:uncharacterized protein YecT (DUF1311 family)